MKLWNRRSAIVCRSLAIRCLVLGVAAIIPIVSSGDDYYEGEDLLDQDVQVASDSTPLDSQPVEMHDNAVAAENWEDSEWVDPTLAETCPCTKADNAACPGVCKDPGHPKKPKHPRPGDIDEGDCPSKRYRMDDCIRSGNPNCVYKWAAPSITSKYSAWYVGGGAAFKGRGRKSSEGTWGLDYDGLFGHARTWLNYTCDKEQGGEGAYETDHVPLKKK